MDLVKTHQTKAASDLYRAIAATEEGNNVFISPFSISTVLSMVWAGAGGDTAAQLRKVLALPEDGKQLHEEYGKLLQSLQRAEHVDLSTANRLYVQKTYKILEAYSTLLQEKYLAALQSVEFADAAGTSKMINDEVEQLTKGKIKDLVPASALNAMVRAVLVNAIYFKGEWEQPFDKESTRKREFFVSKGTSVQTDMMFLDGKRFLAGELKDLACKALEMPYKGGRFSMLMLLPDDKEGLKDLEGKLHGVSIESIRGKLDRRPAMVIMPKFKLETSYELVQHLQTLGITDIFDESRADLSNISGTKDLFVSKVIHKAFVEVNEAGTEAAAATGLIACAMSLPMDLLEFVADHPFFFAIIDTQSGLPMFSGRFVKPE